MYKSVVSLCPVRPKYKRHLRHAHTQPIAPATCPLYLFLLIVVFATSALAANKPKPKPPVVTIGPEEIVATRAELTRAVTKNPSWPDSPLGVIKPDDASPGHYWFIASGGDGLGSPGISHGTLKHIVSNNLVYPVAPILDITTHQPIVPDRYTYAGSGPLYVDRKTGLFIQFAHLENSFGNEKSGPFYSRLGLVVSKNKGRSWQFVDEIVTPTVSFADWKAYVRKKPDRPWLDIGAGSHAIVSDGDVSYFYVYLRDFGYPASQDNVHLAVARAKVVDVISAAMKGGNVVWNKYYKERWDEPAIGGKSSPLENGRAPIDMQLDVKYNAYLKQYIMVTGSIFDTPGYVELTTSIDGLSWSPRIKIAESLTPDNKQSVACYPSIVGTDPDPTIPGKIFYIYVTKHAFEQEQMEVTRRQITLQ